MSKEQYKPSALIIAPKRSGTNFAVRIFSPAFTSAVNEPLGLHGDVPNGKRNPLSPWEYSSVKDVSQEYGHSRLKDDPYGALLAKQFLGWLNRGEKLIKETDFLYLEWLLASANLKPLVIHRDPRASIASVLKNDLYNRWGFDSKLQRFINTVMNSPLNNLYGNKMPFQEKFPLLPVHQQLAFYYGVAMQEIDRVIKSYDPFEITYNELIRGSDNVLMAIVDYFQGHWNSAVSQAARSRTLETRSSDAYSTFKGYGDLEPFEDVLTREQLDEIDHVFSALGIRLKSVGKGFPKPFSIRELQEERRFMPVTGSKEQSVQEVRKSAVRVDTDTGRSFYVGKTVVSNYEYARFLQWITDNRIPMAINGKPLFYNDLPDGYIHKRGSQIFVDEKYADYPVNFINWVGAAAYSVWIGGRLPTGNEWETGIIRGKKNVEKLLLKANVGEKFGLARVKDHRFPPDERGIHDVLGNVSIWLTDESGNPYERMLAGLEWNHTPELGLLPRPRPWWLGTSGLGIRTAFDSVNRQIPESVFLAKMQELVQLVTQHHEDHTQVSTQIFQLFDQLFSYNQSHEE